MDRHLTYVAMTRHRDGVALYADRSEFTDMNALTARLSRSQAKETTLDYDRAAEFAVDGRQRGANAKAVATCESEAMKSHKAQDCRITVPAGK